MGSQLPTITFRYRPGKSLALNGGCSVHISQSRHPVDQISHLRPYFLPFQIYGLVQQGVPVWVEHIPLSRTLETFRSPSFAIPSTKNTFALLISRWTILFLCRIFSPWKSQNATFQMKVSSNPSPWFCLNRKLIFPSRSPPSAYYMTTQRLWFQLLKKEPLQLMTQGMLMDASSLTSLRALSFYLSFKRVMFTDLMAYSFWSFFLRTNCTLPKLPLPRSFTISKSLKLRLFCSIINRRKLNWINIYILKNGSMRQITPPNKFVPPCFSLSCLQNLFIPEMIVHIKDQAKDKKFQYFIIVQRMKEKCLKLAQNHWQAHIVLERRNLETTSLSSLMSHNYLLTEFAILTHFYTSPIVCPIFIIFARAREWLWPSFVAWEQTAKSNPQFLSSFHTNGPFSNFSVFSTSLEFLSFMWVLG